MSSISRRLVVGGLASFASAPFAANAQQLRGQRFAVVEIGASGVKTAILEFNLARLPEYEEQRGDNASQAGRYERYERNQIGQFTANPVIRERSQIAQAVAAVADAITTSTGPEYNVPRQNIVVVASSSVATLPHRPEIEAAFRARNIQLDFITSAQEAEYAFRWLVLRHRWTEAALTDIGSGNVKGGYISSEGRQTFQPYEIPDGSRGLAARASAVAHHPSEEWDRALIEASRDFIATPAARAVSVSPGLRGRPRHYLIGGAPWAFTSLMYPAESVSEESHWVAIDPRLISAFREETFAETAFDNPGLQERIARIPSPQAQEEARRLVGRVQDAISQDQLKAGMQILATMSREFAFSGKSVFFAKEGLYAWPTMHLLTRLGVEQPA